MTYLLADCGRVEIGAMRIACLPAQNVGDLEANVSVAVKRQSIGAYPATGNTFSAVACTEHP
jgi:hypothetical protein